MISKTDFLPKQISKRRPKSPAERDSPNFSLWKGEEYSSRLNTWWSESFVKAYSCKRRSKGVIRTGIEQRKFT